MTTKKKTDWQHDMVWREDVKIGKELCYSIGVINKLKAEPDHNARMRILHDARVGKTR